MYNKVECIILNCDNCQGHFENYSGFSIFADNNSLREDAEEEGWYLGHLDGEHKGKHYCTDCFKHHETEDDVIIVHTSRKVNPSNT